MKTLLLALLVLAFTATGCETAWNLANRSALKRDVAALLMSAGTANNSLNCQMAGTTRTGMCEGRFTSEEVEEIVSNFKLDTVGDAPVDRDYVTWTKEGTCSRRRDWEMRYKSERRAPSLRLKNGSAFEYFLLFYSPGTGSGCIQVSYAYG